MSFDLKKTHYYLGVWRAKLGDDHGDVLAMLWKDEADDRYHLKWRFRYYMDDKFFESQDKRNWYEVRSRSGDISEGERMQAVMSNLLEMGGHIHNVHDITFIPCNGDGDAMAKIMMNPERPGTQWISLTQEQEQEYLKTLKLPEGVEPKGDL